MVDYSTPNGVYLIDSVAVPAGVVAVVAVGVEVLSLPGELVSMTVVPGAIAVVIPAEGASAGVGVAHGGISLTVPRVIAVVIGPLLSLAVLRMPGRVIVRAHDGVVVVLEDGAESI